MLPSLRTLALAILLLAPTFAVAQQDSIEIKGKLEETDANDPVRRQPCKVHEVKLSKGNAYQIDLASKDFDSYLRLVDSAGKEVAKDDDGAGGGSLNARIRYTPTDDGSFKIYCTTFAGGAGEYTLTVQGAGAEVVAGGKAPKAAPAEVVLDVQGKIAGDDNPDPVRRNPCKIHEVKLKKGVAYQLDLMSKEFDSYMRLEDGNGRELAKDDDGGGKLNARIRFTPDDDGTFKIYATTFGGGQGNYTLVVKSVGAGVAKEAGGVIQLAAPTAAKASEHQGRIQPGDAADALRRRPSKTFTVELKKGQTYVIDLMSDDFDSFLRLESPTGQQLAQDDDGGNGLNSRIEFRCPADGRYRLIASTFQGRSEGAFTIRVAAAE